MTARKQQVGPDAVIKKYERSRAGHQHQPVWLGKLAFRDARGRPHQHGRTRFAVVVCNDPDCKFEALVNVEALVASYL